MRTYRTRTKNSMMISLLALKGILYVGVVKSCSIHVVGLMLFWATDIFRINMFSTSEK
jgi:hypothetical protein